MTSRDDHSRYSELTGHSARTYRTAHSTTSYASGASVSSEQRAKDHVRQHGGEGDWNGRRQRDGDKKKKGSRYEDSRRRDRSNDRYTSSNAGETDISLTPSKSASNVYTPSRVTSALTLKPLPIRSNLSTGSRDKTVLVDLNNGGRRAMNPSKGRPNYSASTQGSRRPDNSLQNSYDPRASRAPTELTKQSIARLALSGNELEAIRRRNTSDGSVINSVMNHMEAKAGRPLGNTLYVDGNGVPMGVGNMSLGSEHDGGGVFKMEKMEGLNLHLPRRDSGRVETVIESDIPGTRSNSSKRTVVPPGYKLPEKGSNVSRVTAGSNSSRRTMVPYGHNFDRGSAIFRNSSQYQPTGVSSRPPVWSPENGCYVDERKPNGL